MATAGYAIKLDGTTQYMTVADNAHHDYATGNAFTFGVRFWLDFDYDSGDRVYLWHRANQHSCWIENGRVMYYINGHSGPLTWNTGAKVVPNRVHQLVITGSEATDTTLCVYLDGLLVGTTTLTGGMPDDTDTILYVGTYHSGVSASLFLNGTLCEWFQSNTTAFSAANVVTAWNSGVADIDTLEAITGLIDNIGFEENTGTSYAGGKAGSVSGAGVGTPLWATTPNLGMKTMAKGFVLTTVGEAYGLPVMLRSIEWLGDAIADGDDVELVDVHGKTLFAQDAKADDTGFVKEFDQGEIWNGFSVKTLGHGTLRLYVR